MKKGVLFILVVFLIIVGYFVSFNLIKTGKIGNLSNSTSSISNISFVGNGYAFAKGLNTNWKLFDLDGNLIFELPEGYAPKSKVINGYFYAGHDYGTTDYNIVAGKFYKIDGTEPFEGSNNIVSYIGFTGDKINTNNYVYLIKTETETKDFDGTHKEEHVYNISKNLEECSDDVSWDNIMHGSAKYSLANKFTYADFDAIYNPGFQVNPRKTTHLDVYVKENNGYFAHMKDEEQLYEPIKGILYRNYGFSTDVMAKIDDKYYIVKEDGSKKEIDYIPDDYYIKEFYDGYIIATSLGLKQYLFDPNGNKIEFKI